jgi:hypothetical protein
MYLSITYFILCGVCLYRSRASTVSGVASARWRRRLLFLTANVFAPPLRPRVHLMSTSDVEALSPTPTSLHSDLESLNSEMSFESIGQNAPLATDAERPVNDDAETARWKTHSTYSKPDWTVCFLVCVIA